MATPKRVEVLGAPVDCVDLEGALAAIDTLIAGPEARAVVAVNPEKVIKAQSDPVLRRSLASAGLLIPDGIGVVYAVRLLRHERLERVPGAELMPAICARAALRGYPVFLFGASREVNEKASAVLAKEYPGLVIAGHHHGYVDDAAMPDLVAAINASGAQVLFVALGSPRQELWMEKYLPELRHVRVCQGVGGTFDVIAGRVRRAPLAFRRANLEWFYRLVTEPRRAIRQIVLPRFTYQVFREKLFG
ncbi:MAG: WecB/TagA/CpsF family glycosyltransferase [Chromatiales bacterium]|nr:WecB/TagA/CpsF family glycosyltransferase [Chromatiales bacterium]